MLKNHDKMTTPSILVAVEKLNFAPMLKNHDKMTTPSILVAVEKLNFAPCDLSFLVVMLS
jgi:hypothetical protein